MAPKTKSENTQSIPLLHEVFYDLLIRPASEERDEAVKQFLDNAEDDIYKLLNDKGVLSSLKETTKEAEQAAEEDRHGIKPRFFTDIFVDLT